MVYIYVAVAGPGGGGTGTPRGLIPPAGWQVIVSN